MNSCTAVDMWSSSSRGRGGSAGDGMSDVEFELGVSWVAGGVERRADLMSSGESFLVIGYVVSEVTELRP